MLFGASIEEIDAEVTRHQLPSVLGDRAQITQLVQNLIGNGLKYHGDEAPSVHVSAMHGDGLCTFVIRDNGIGIADKHLERIFETFRRLHTQKEYPGTGIGLALCRRIVNRHGGRIWVESEEGQGSTFFVALHSGETDEVA